MVVERKLAVPDDCASANQQLFVWVVVVSMIEDGGDTDAVAPLWWIDVELLR